MSKIILALNNKNINLNKKNETNKIIFSSLNQDILILRNEKMISESKNVYNKSILYKLKKENKSLIN